MREDTWNNAGGQISEASWMHQLIGLLDTATLNARPVTSSLAMTRRHSSTSLRLAWRCLAF
ncbi:MAG: hypothetical protein O2925_00175 [Actinomycetota bacterium]|nr:hypothetical protein [Actinomycetota bacterium]MDA3015032.1 hypothetical protein [Actinomycetota bacterium]MDA3027186.1 hypothetical protein [Actinomycetota bacterium]